MKKIVSLALVFLLIACMFSSTILAQVEVEEGYDYTQFKDDNITLNVYNWGEYISDGSDESLDVVKEFEQLTGIDVNYTTYDTNESLYTKIKSGAADYDVIIPSDYMIGKMANEGLLAELDLNNIPNVSMIGDQYKSLAYDPNNKYSVPFTWGVVGIIYNTTMVDDVVDSWDIMWNEKYKGQILMFNNSRDAFMIALKKIGLSMNPTTQKDIDAAVSELKKQKPLVQAYVMDEIFDKMENGEAAIAPYYAGDALTMISENPDLAFAIPKEGTNYFVDAMCIPVTSKNKQAAEMFINFMCETEIALANTEYIGYSTAQLNAVDLLSDEMKNNPIAYPASDVIKNTETFVVLSDEINAAMDKAWSSVKSYDGGQSKYIIPVILLIVIVAIVARKVVKKKRDNY